MAYQPIIQVKSGKIFGFEALARVINTNLFNHIMDLFTLSQKLGKLYPIETLCRRLAIESANSVLNSPIKWALLETFVSFSKRIGCKVIAEGVETLEEFQTVVQLGVDYIQGYFVGKPNFTRVPTNDAIPELLNKHRPSKFGKHKLIGMLVEPSPVFDLETPITRVDKYFRSTPGKSFVTVTDRDRVVGLMDREKLYTTLGPRYGIALCSSRPIKTIMNKDPLVVEDTTPIELVCTLAFERCTAQRCDCIVVVNQNRFLGLVKVAALVKAISDQ